MPASETIFASAAIFIASSTFSAPDIDAKMVERRSRTCGGVSVADIGQL